MILGLNIDLDIWPLRFIFDQRDFEFRNPASFFFPLYPPQFAFAINPVTLPPLAFTNEFKPHIAIDSDDRQSVKPHFEFSGQVVESHRACPV